jgi:hypothetical protein
VRVRGALSSFLLDKYQYLFAIRPSYGYEKVLFRKSPEEGVQLNAIIGAGPTLGFTKPYYILVAPNPNDLNNYNSVPYNPPDTRRDNIVGVGSVADGFNQLKFVPGVHVRAGLGFESGKYNYSVFGLEVGILTEIYANGVQLMKAPNALGNSGGYQSRNWFNSLYLTVYYGTKH